MGSGWAVGTKGISIIVCICLGSIVLSLTQAEEDDFFGSLDTSSIKEPTSDEADLKCHTSSMCVHLEKEWLRTQFGVTSKADLTLRQRCDASLEDTDTHFILCTLKGRLTACGSELAQNDTHVSFSNNVHILLPAAPGLVRDVVASLPWTCTYPKKLLVGVNFAPQISPITVFLGNKTGYGEFEAEMQLYEDETFRQPYEHIPELHITDRLRVKVQLLRGPMTSRIQVVRCWGTPIPTPKEEEDSKYTLIDDYCPSVESSKANVKLRNNGDLQHVIWESNVFRFVSSPDVYIHCHVKVCFSGPKCEKKCTADDDDSISRKRREIGPGAGLLSIGPLSVGNDVPGIAAGIEATDFEGEATESSPEDIEEPTILGMPKMAVFGMIGALAAVCLILVIGVSVGIHRKTKQKSRAKTEAFWKAQADSRRRLSGRFTLSNAPPFEIPMTVPNTLATESVESQQ